MNHYITRDAQMPGYLIFPRALLQMELTAAEVSVYMLLLDRSRLSVQNEKWIDGEGRAFLYFPILELAKAIGRSDTAVKKALRGLEEKDLISRKRQGLGKPSRIYAKLPEDGNEAASPESKDASPAESKDASSPEGKDASPAESWDASPRYGKEASSPWARKLPSNKNYRDKTKESSLPKRPKGPTVEDYERMQRFLKELEKQAEKGPQAPLTPRPPAPSPGRPPSYP